MEPLDYDTLLPSKMRCMNTPGIHERAFTHFSRMRKNELDESSVIEKILTEEFDELSKRLDLAEIQASTSVRNVLTARRLSIYLIDDKGEVEESNLSLAIAVLEKNLFSLGPRRAMDAPKRRHILKILKLLRDDKQYRVLLKKIDRPYQNAGAEQLIRDTLQLPPHSPVNDAMARRAALSAALCTLRQSVGSCFATAPCIMIHEEQPRQFLIDLAELLGTGRLKRTFGGEEFSAPLSGSWGAGDLKRQISLANPLEASVPEIWHSPGLINALESVGILDKKLSLKERRAHLKAACETLLEPGDRQKMSVENLLQRLLLKELDLTEKDLEEYLSRPTAMIHSGLMMHVSSSSGRGKGVGQRCKKFLEDLEIAKSAFKALSDNALLKSWEFTIATFTETKAKFSSWNLYASLGFNAKDPHGLGQVLWNALHSKLEEENRKIEEYQEKYEQTYSQVRYMEGRFKRSRDDREARWLRAELQMTLQEFNNWEELRNKAKFKAESFANLYDVLVHEYMQLFPKYFQEVYDADMRHVEAGLYDDSPAGFQLLYKHGRAATSAWTPVGSVQEFVDALVSFFSTTEHEIVHNPVMTGFEDDLVQIISAFITHVKTEEFLESAFYRMARAHGTFCPEKPLENLDKIEKKPWAYTSGGSLETLLQCYFKLNQPPTHVERWIESPIELLVFLIDTMKEAPEKVRQAYLADEQRAMLMTSPTHAFLFKPGKEPLCEGWEKQEFTYTWCRDALVEPMAGFVRRISLDSEMIELALKKLKLLAPSMFRERFEALFLNHPKRASAAEFRDYFLKTLREDSALKAVSGFYWSADKVDALLYEMLPFSREYQVRERIALVLGALGLEEGMKQRAQEASEEILKRCDAFAALGADSLRALIQTAVLIAQGTTFTAKNIPFEIHKIMQASGFSMPSPIIFADTNWVDYRFGFVVSPGTEELELWRLEETGSRGYPMSMWKMWLDGTRKSPQWEVYAKPFEYLV